MKLYKFRSLGSRTDLKRATDIVKTGEFWCSQFWELNDPMEGVYSYTAGTLTDEDAKEIFHAKSQQVLCSFSGIRAFRNPLLWGYYGNGFKGVAVEIEVDRQSLAIHKVEYVKELFSVNSSERAHGAAHRILTTKLRCWKHEIEYRHLSNGRTGLRAIGSIKAVHFGVPYGRIDNSADVQASAHLREYGVRARSLIKVARFRGIPCHAVVWETGRVRSAGPFVGAGLPRC